MNSRPSPRQIVQTAYARFYATEAERRNSRRRTAIMGRERKPWLALVVIMHTGFSRKRLMTA